MIVTTPTDDWLKSALEQCKQSLAVSSPYIGVYFASAVKKLAADIQVTILTRTSLTDFAGGASDLGAVHDLALRAGGVHSLNSLHAKVYVVDQRKALVTSANATFSGMRRNWECGVELTSRSDVKVLSDLLATGFGCSPRPHLWSAEELAQLFKSVESLRATIPKGARKKDANIEGPQKLLLRQRERKRFVGGLTGWLQLTYEGISRIQDERFSMQQVFDACSPIVAERFPNNKNVREKLRQQMQRLRDLGIVLFLGDGQYEQMVR